MGKLLFIILVWGQESPSMKSNFYSVLMEGERLSALPKAHLSVCTNYVDLTGFFCEETV